MSRSSTIASTIASTIVSMIVSRIAPVLLAAFLTTVIAAPATAAPQAPAGKAAAMSRVVGLPAGYVMSANFTSTNFNGQGGSINVMNFLGTGSFEVTFGNLGEIGNSGIVQVTPFNQTGTCAVEDWGASNTDLNVFVLCYNLAGHPANNLFNLIVTEPAVPPPHGTLDYALVDREKSSGLLTGKNSYNSAGKANSSKHLGIGRYQVTFGGGPTSGTHGTVKVTAFGSGAGDCSAVGWHGSRKGQVIDVNCDKRSGTPVNRMFDVTFANHTNLMGLNGFGFPTVNALVSATGRVQAQYDSEHGANVTVVHHNRGLYQVRMNGLTAQFNDGNVQVSPITDSNDHCIVTSWGSGFHNQVVANVHCVDSHGHSVNSAFTIQYVEAFLA